VVRRTNEYVTQALRYPLKFLEFRPGITILLYEHWGRYWFLECEMLLWLADTLTFIFSTIFLKPLQSTCPRTCFTAHLNVFTYVGNTWESTSTSAATSTSTSTLWCRGCCYAFVAHLVRLLAKCTLESCMNMIRTFRPSFAYVYTIHSYPTYSTYINKYITYTHKS